MFCLPPLTKAVKKLFFSKNGEGKMRRLVLFVFFALAALCVGVGISVSPATFLLQNVPLGERYDITGAAGYRIRISGVSRPGNYVITPRRPSEDGTKATGYYDIPDASWFGVEECTLFVSPDKPAETAMWIDFPDDPSLYNRHFLLGVDVSPTLESTRGMLAVGAYLLFRFETPPKEGVVPKLQKGEMAFVPSVVSFEDLRKGDVRSYNLKLFTWTEQPQKIKLYRLDPESDVAKITILLTRGFRRAPEGVVLFPEEISASSAGGKLFVQVALAEELPYRRMEELVMAEAPNGNKAFLRVRLFGAQR